MSRVTAAIIIVILVALDQISKWVVETTLPFHERVDVIPFWSLYRTHNEGVAFSFLSSLNDWVLVAFTVAIIGFVFWLWLQADKEKWISQIGFILILAGAVGNLIDRALLGYVVDFILFHTQTWSFAVFNIADSLITVGAAAIIIDEVLDFRRQSRQDKSHDTTE